MMSISNINSVNNKNDGDDDDNHLLHCDVDDIFLMTVPWLSHTHLGLVVVRWP